MKSFLVIYYAPASASLKMKDATPEEKMAGMKPWMDWKAAHDNNIVNFGAPLMQGQLRGPSTTWQVSEKEVSGFSIVQGESQESVQGMCKDHPHLAWDEGAQIGVYEFAPM